MKDSQGLVEKLRLGLKEFGNLRRDYDYRIDKYKLGRVLTVIDGTIADPEQRKAVKDLIHSLWYEGSNSPEFGGNPREKHLFEALTGEELYNDDGLVGPNLVDEFNPFTDKLK